MVVNGGYRKGNVRRGTHELEDGGGVDAVRLVLEVEDDVVVADELSRKLLPP